VDIIGDVDKPILSNNIAAATNTTFLLLSFFLCSCHEFSKVDLGILRVGYQTYGSWSQSLIWIIYSIAIVI
jgi:hypothetical protein